MRKFLFGLAGPGLSKKLDHHGDHDLHPSGADSGQRSVEVEQGHPCGVCADAARDDFDHFSHFGMQRYPRRMFRISEDDVRRLLPMRDCIEQLRVAFRDYAEGKAQNQPRRRLVLPTGATLHSLAGAWGNYFGTKIYSTHSRYGAHFTFLLYEASTGNPLAEFEANWLGQIRTGAASGLAVDLLLKPDQPVTVGCIGSGFQAESQIQAVRAVRTVRDLRVFSRSEDKRQSFAQHVRGIPVASPEEAAAGCDVLITATWAKDPVIAAEAVPAGAIVLAMGSNQPQRRELPAELVQQSFIVVDDREACRIEAGDLLLALDDQGWKRTVDLRDLVARNIARPENQTTIFKSVGLGLEDVAAGALVFERIRASYS